jgi:hypothetical protein
MRRSCPTANIPEQILCILSGHVLMLSRQSADKRLMGISHHMAFTMFLRLVQPFAPSTQTAQNRPCLAQLQSQQGQGQSHRDKHQGAENTWI